MAWPVDCITLPSRISTMAVASLNSRLWPTRAIRRPLQNNPTLGKKVVLNIMDGLALSMPAGPQSQPNTPCITAQFSRARIRWPSMRSRSSGSMDGAQRQALRRPSCALRADRRAGGLGHADLANIEVRNVRPVNARELSVCGDDLRSVSRSFIFITNSSAPASGPALARLSFGAHKPTPLRMTPGAPPDLRTGALRNLALAISGGTSIEAAAGLRNSSPVCRAMQQSGR